MEDSSAAAPIQPEMPPVTSTAPHKANSFPRGLVVFVVILIAVTGYLLYQNMQLQKENAALLAAKQSEAPPQVTVTPKAIATPSTDPNIKTVSSDRLGIRFSYKYNYYGSTVSTKEVDNKIYVYDASTPAEKGQYVEVFSKSPDDSLESAVAKKFLTGYSSSDCTIQDGMNSKLPATFEIVQIGVPLAPNEDLTTIIPKWEKCPKPYTATNGMAYFVMDKNVPSKFAFVSIGQYAIDATPGKTWQDTLEFVK